MRRGELATRIISAVVVIAVVAYMAVYISSALSNPLETAEAVLATAEDTVPISGWFARDESRVSAAISGSAVSLRGEGEKVGAGESLIVSYTSSSARSTREQIDALDRRIAELEAATSDASVGDINRLDSELQSSVYSLAYSAATGSYGDAAESATELKTLMLRRDYASGRYGEEAFEGVLNDLKNERTLLESRIGGAEIAVTAPTSGYFSTVADGYEEVLDMESVLDMTLEDIRALDGRASEVEQNCCGKLVRSFGWRFLSAMKAEDAAQLNAGSWVTMRFTGDYVGEVRVRVYRIGEVQNGECAVVFSCATDIAPLVGLRRESAELVLREHEGVRIPKAAVRVDEEGNSGVFIVVATQAQFVKMDIATAYETENYYIVAYDPASTSSIRPGDEIVVRSKNLFDGKVLK